MIENFLAEKMSSVRSKMGAFHELYDWIMSQGRC